MQDNSVRDTWYALAEQTEDVFRRPTIAHQGKDGIGHFNYYDRDRALSFQWDGYFDQHVTVSQGGYGEAVKWTFSFPTIWPIGVAPFIADRGPHIDPKDPFRSTAWHFQSACMKWIEKMEQEMEGLDV